MHFSADSETVLPLEPQRHAPHLLPPTVLPYPWHPSPAQRPAYLGPTYLGPSSACLIFAAAVLVCPCGRWSPSAAGQLRHELLLVGAPWEKSGTARRHQRRQGAAQCQPPSRAGDGSPVPPAGFGGCFAPQAGS